MQKVSVTELRNSIYKLVDRVIATGEPLEIAREGRSIYLNPEPVGNMHVEPNAPGAGLLDRLSKLPKRRLWLGSEEELENYRVWDEEEWLRKWDERLGK